MAPNMPQPAPPPKPNNQNPAQVASIPQNTQLQPDLTGQSYVGGMLPTIRVMPASANANAAINSISQTVTQNVTNVVIPTIPPPTFGQITTGQNLQATMLVGTGAFLGYANYFINGSLVGSTAFIQGEPVIQSVSGATSVVAAFFNGQIQLGPIVGAPNSTGAWTGQTSGAIYSVTALPTVSSGTVNASEIGTITVKGSVPAHAGQLLISQPGNTSAVWADPQVQGLYAAGSSIASPPAYTSPTTICPVGVGGSKAGVLQYLLLDSSGNLQVSLGGATTISVVGTLTNNNAAPSNNNLGVLPAVANAAVQSWTEGDQVLLSTDLSGKVRTLAFQGTSPWVENVSQFGGSNVVTGTGASGAGIPRFTVSNDSQVKIWDGTTQASVIVATNALKTDLSSVAGSATATATTGVQLVGIEGRAGTSLETTAGVLDYNLKNVNNVAVNIGTGAASTGTQRVAVSNDSKVQPWDGTNTVTVKAANTASVDADTSLVVQLNPKQPNLDLALNVALPNTQKVIVWDGTTQNTYKAASTASVVGDTSLVTQISPNQPTALMIGTVPGTSPGNTVITGGIYNSSAPTFASGQTGPLQLDVNGKVLFSGSFSQAAVGATGSAIPASADYLGINIGGNLRGATGHNPAGTVYAIDCAIVDASGNQITSFGGGTQFADAAASGAHPTGTQVMVWAKGSTTEYAATGRLLTNAQSLDVSIVDGSGNQITSFGGGGSGTQYADNAASGSTPTGTLSMGWDSANSKVRALKVDTNQALEVSTGYVDAHSVGGGDSGFPMMGYVISSGKFYYPSIDNNTDRNLNIDLQKIAGSTGFFNNSDSVNINTNRWGAAVVGAAATFGTAPTGNAPGVNSSIFAGTTALTQTTFGTSPGAVAALSVNASLIDVRNTVAFSVKAANLGAVANDTSIVTTLSPQSGVPANTTKGNNKATTAKTTNVAGVVVAAHQTIIVVAGSGNFAASNWTAAVSDGTNTYVLDSSINNSTTAWAGVFRSTNATAGTYTITFTISGSSSANTTVQMEVYVVDGLLEPASPLDQTATNAPSTTTSVTTSSVYPQGPNEYAFMAIAAPAAEASITAGGAWTADYTSNDSVLSFASMSQLLPAMNGVAGAATLASTAAYAAVVVTYRTPAENVSGTMQLEGAGNVASVLSNNALKTDLSSVAGTAALTGNGVTGAGSQRVTIASDNTAFAVNATLSAETTKVIGTARVVGNVGGVFDAATAASVPANAIQVGARGATANPTAVTDGQLVAPMADKLGRQAVVLNHVRDLITATPTTITNSSSATSVMAAGAAGVFRDIISLIITQSSGTATTATLSDGTASYIFDLAATAGTGLSIQFPTPLPATSTATAWTLQLGVNTITVHVTVIAVNNK